MLRYIPHIFLIWFLSLSSIGQAQSASSVSTELTGSKGSAKILLQYDNDFRKLKLVGRGSIYDKLAADVEKKQIIAASFKISNVTGNIKNVNHACTGGYNFRHFPARLRGNSSNYSSFIEIDLGGTFSSELLISPDSNILRITLLPSDKTLKSADVRRHGFCLSGEISSSILSKIKSRKKNDLSGADFLADGDLCKNATNKYGWKNDKFALKFVKAAYRRGLECGLHTEDYSILRYTDAELCELALKTSESDSPISKFFYERSGFKFDFEANRRGLDCNSKGSNSTQIASQPVPSTNKAPSDELTAAQKEAERLRKELAALKAEQQQEQQIISNDNRIPIIDQLSANTSGKQGIISGRVRDNTGVAELTVDGMVVQVGSDGQFEHRTFIPASGKQIIIEATDLAGLTSQEQIGLSRNIAIQSASISFDSLNPLGRRVAKNSNALALVIGVASYENTPAPAIYADSDALMFRDYASEKLGIPENRIKTLVNDTADEREVLLSIKNWLARSIKQEKTDVYVFFAGHGLASDDGKDMYLMPYDGAPELLERTAILRDELFSDIAAANPRSVTVFLDTCYSGTTRGTDMLIASRPIAIQVKQQNIPDGFTVFTAAGGDQTAKPLEEAKHGMFSYFLMKGMEGDADSNLDNQITAAELHEYVEQNVVQQSGGSQVPELQGDAERVLVRFK